MLHSKIDYLRVYKESALTRCANSFKLDLPDKMPIRSVYNNTLFPEALQLQDHGSAFPGTQAQIFKQTNLIM